MITVYGIKNCDSVKKALKFFKDASIEVAFIDFRTTPLTLQTITHWVALSDISTLFNHRSRTYRDLDLASQDLDTQAKIAWMHKEPLLIKRPVIEYGDNKLFVGFDETSYKGTFLS